MSLLSGVPIGPDIEPSRRRLVFHHVPRLRELLKDQVRIGVTYAQVCVQNLKAANDRTEKPANLRAVRNTQYYEIQGPLGTAQMALLGSNVPVPSSNSAQGEPLCFVDAEVEALTGLEAPAYPERDEKKRLAYRKYLIHFSRVPTLPIPAPEPVRSSWVEPPPKPAKRPYKRKKPWGSPAQRAALAKAKSKTYRKPHGQWGAERLDVVDKEPTHGQVEPGAQAAEGQESNGGVSGGDAA